MLFYAEEAITKRFMNIIFSHQRTNTYTTFIVYFIHSLNDRYIRVNQIKLTYSHHQCCPYHVVVTMSLFCKLLPRYRALSIKIWHIHPKNSIKASRKTDIHLHHNLHLYAKDNAFFIGRIIIIYLEDFAFVFAQNVYVLICKCIRTSFIM